jgi:hypothetical protein
MRVKLTLFALPLLLVFALAGDPPADEAVVAAIDKGREAFKAGRDQEAIEQLQKAIGLIQAKAMKGLEAFLPTRDAEKWEAGEIDSQSGNWGSGETAFTWSQVQRRYTKKGVEDGPEVTVMITSWPQMIEGQRAMMQMYKDPAMRAMIGQDPNGPKMELIEKDGWVGMITTQNDDCSIVTLHEKIMVQVQVNKAETDIAKEFWDAMDRKGLGEATSK